MRARRILGLTASATMLALAACSAIAGLDGDYREGALDGAASVDSNTSTNNDAHLTGDAPVVPSDGSVDSNTPDATVGDDDDASADATVDADADAGQPFNPTMPATATKAAHWCLGPAAKSAADAGGRVQRYCFDYDPSATDPGLGWDMVEPSSGAGVSLVGPTGTDDYVMRVTVSASGTSNSTYVRGLFGNSTADPDHPNALATNHSYLLTFQFRIKTATTYAMLAGFDFWGGQYGLAVYPNGCGPAGATVDCLAESQQATAPTTEKATAFTPNVWYDARIVVTKLSPTDWSSTISVGGKVLATRSMGAMPSTASGDNISRVIVGAFHSGTTGTTTVDFDDITVFRIPDP